MRNYRVTTDDSYERPLQQVMDLFVRGYEFTGVVEVDGKDIKIKGEFVLDWDDQYPLVHVSPMWIYGIDDVRFIDLEDLRAQIQETDDGEWYNEHMNNLSENQAQLAFDLNGEEA